MSERNCGTCSRELLTNNKGIQSGYYCCDEYFCTALCLDKSFNSTPETWENHYSDDGDCYFTEWDQGL